MKPRHFLMEEVVEGDGGGGDPAVETPAVEDPSEVTPTEETATEEVELPSHLSAFSEMSAEDVSNVVNGSKTYNLLSKHPDFQRLLSESIHMTVGGDNFDLDSFRGGQKPTQESQEDLSNLDDTEVFKKFLAGEVTSTVREELKPILEALGLLSKDFQSRQLSALKEKHPDIENRLSDIASFKQNNPWSAEMPAEEVLKLLDHDNMKSKLRTEIVDELKNGKNGIKPNRGASPTSVNLKDKASMKDTMEWAAKKHGIELRG